jgi:hypothetical protein
MNAAMSKLEQTLDLYEEAGLELFPLRPRSKVPLERGWQTNPYPREALMRYVGEGCNLGVRLNEDWLVIDWDPRKYETPEEAESDYERLLRDFGIDELRCPVGISGDDGRHIYLRKPREMAVRGKVPGFKGMDVKKRGGYVVAPGSTHPNGKLYKWDFLANPLKQAPSATPSLCDALSRRENKPRSAESRTVVLDGDTDVAWARQYLRDNVALPEGAGSDGQSYKIACTLRDRAISEETATALMTEEWDHPHDDEWLAQKVANAYRYAAGDAGSTSAYADFEAVGIDDLPVVARAPSLPSRQPRLRVYRIADRFTISTTPWRVDGLIPENGLIVAYGQPKVGKTFYAMGLSISVATGTPFFGQRTLRGPATYIAAEGNAARLLDRARAWCAARGIQEADTAEWELIALPVDVTNNTEVSRLIDTLNGPRAVIVIDTLARCMSGDENTQKDMGAFVKGCDRIREATGAAVLILHHEGKNASKGARGSTVLGGAIDIGLRVRRIGASIAVKVEDQRDGEKIPEMRFELRNVVLGGLKDASAALVQAETTIANDSAQVLDLAIEMGDRTRLKDLAALIVERAGIAPSTARRRIEQTIRLSKECAVAHEDSMIWLEKTNADNPRSGLIVRVEKSADVTDDEI